MIHRKGFLKKQQYPPIMQSLIRLAQKWSHSKIGWLTNKIALALAGWFAAIGVESDGTPFISAEQSGGQIEYQLSGNATHLMTDNSLQGRRSGDRFIMGRGPVTGQTLADEATTTLATLSGCMSQIILIVDSGGGGGVFWCTYQSTVTKLAGSGDYASSDSDGSTCVFKSSTLMQLH